MEAINKLSSIVYYSTVGGGRNISAVLQGGKQRERRRASKTARKAEDNGDRENPP